MPKLYKLHIKVKIEETFSALKNVQNSPLCTPPWFWRTEDSPRSSNDLSWQAAAPWDGLSLTICVWMCFSSWPDLNLSDIQHNHSPHARAHSTWGSSQNSSGAGIQSLVHVVGLHFLKNAQQQRSEVPVCAGKRWAHEYFTSKKNLRMPRSLGWDPSK